MGKKIKKRSNTGQTIVNPLLEEVEEERAFEVELDDETNEIIFVHHYRRKWGDEFEADIEHGLNIEEAGELVGVMLQMIELIQKKAMIEKIQKSTPTPVEGNPLQGPKTNEGE